MVGLWNFRDQGPGALAGLDGGFLACMGKRDTLVRYDAECEGTSCHLQTAPAFDAHLLLIEWQSATRMRHGKSQFSEENLRASPFELLDTSPKSNF